VPRKEKIVTGHDFSLSLPSLFSFLFLVPLFRSLSVSSLHYLSFVYNKNLLSSLSNPLLMLSRPTTEEEEKTHDNGHDERTMTTTR
jgi:uncharacterized protein YqhQ